MPRYAVLLLIALWALPVPALAQAGETGTATQPDADIVRQFEAGVTAYDARDYARAFALWLPLARDGDLAAQRNVAHMLRRGLGVEADLPRAREFYRTSAEAGFVTAQVNLAAMLLAGEGGDPAPEEAAFWFDRAARGGHPLAQYNMGVLYETGRGVEADPARALGWYAAAARGGNEEALSRLADLVMTLPGPETPDMPEMPEMPEMPARDDDPPADDPAPADPPQADTSRADPGIAARLMDAADHRASGRHAQALAGFGALAMEGLAEAQYRLGRMRNRGEGAPRDPVAALAWWTIAAGQDHAQAEKAARALARELGPRQREAAAREADMLRAALSLRRDGGEKDMGRDAAAGLTGYSFDTGRETGR